MKDAGNKHRRSQAEGAGIEGYNKPILKRKSIPYTDERKE